MNHLSLYKKSVDNIFEWRKHQYEKYINGILFLINPFKYFDVSFDDNIQEDYNVGTSLYKSFKGEYRFDGNDTTKSKPIVVKVPAMIKDNVLGFILDGNLRFPVFQWIDDLYYSNKLGVIHITNNFTKYNMRLLNKDLENPVGSWVLEYSRRSIPILFILLLKHYSIEKLLKDLKVTRYQISTTKDKNFEKQIPISKTQYLNYDIPHDEFFANILLDFEKRTLKNLDVDVNNFEEYQLRALNYAIQNSNIGTFKRAKTLLTILKFEDPFTNDTTLNVMYNLFITKEITKIEPRIVNDLSKKRLRLIEPLLYKLYSIVITAKINSDKQYQLLSDEIIKGALHGELIQFDNSVNPISQLAIQTRVTYLGRGGFPREAASLELRNLHESYKGIMDPVDTPLGGNSGIVNFLSPILRLDEHGRHKNNIFYRKEDGEEEG